MKKIKTLMLSALIFVSGYLLNNSYKSLASNFNAQNNNQSLKLNDKNNKLINSHHSNNLNYHINNNLNKNSNLLNNKRKRIFKLSLGKKQLAKNLPNNSSKNKINIKVNNENNLNQISLDELNENFINKKQVTTTPSKKEKKEFINLVNHNMPNSKNLKYPINSIFLDHDDFTIDLAHIKKSIKTATNNLCKNTVDNVANNRQNISLEGMNDTLPDESYKYVHNLRFKPMGQNYVDLIENLTNSLLKQIANYEDVIQNNLKNLSPELENTKQYFLNRLKKGKHFLINIIADELNNFLKNGPFAKLFNFLSEDLPPQKTNDKTYVNYPKSKIELNIIQNRPLTKNIFTTEIFNNLKAITNNGKNLISNEDSNKFLPIIVEAVNHLLYLDQIQALINYLAICFPDETSNDAKYTSVVKTGLSNGKLVDLVEKIRNQARLFLAEFKFREQINKKETEKAKETEAKEQEQHVNIRLILSTYIKIFLLSPVKDENYFSIYSELIDHRYSFDTISEFNRVMRQRKDDLLKMLEIIKNTKQNQNKDKKKNKEKNRKEDKADIKDFTNLLLNDNGLFNKEKNKYTENFITFLKDNQNFEKITDFIKHETENFANYVTKLNNRTSDNNKISYVDSQKVKLFRTKQQSNPNDTSYFDKAYLFTDKNLLFTDKTYENMFSPEGLDMFKSIKPIVDEIKNIKNLNINNSTIGLKSTLNNKILFAFLQNPTLKTNKTNPQKKPNNQPENIIGNQDAHIFNNQPENIIGNQDANIFNNQPENIIGNQDANIFNNQPENIFNNQAANITGNHPANITGNQPENTFNNNPIN